MNLACHLEHYKRLIYCTCLCSKKPQWKTSKNNMSSAKKSFQCCFMLLSFGKHQQRCQFCSIHANLISHSWACAHLLCVFFFKCSIYRLVLSKL